MPQVAQAPKLPTPPPIRTGGAIIPTAAAAPGPRKFPLPMVAVVGDSGTGKSTSYRNMPWANTAVLDTELKGFPFDDSVIPESHYHPCPRHTDVIAKITEYASGKHPHIRYVVLDSFFMFQRAVFQHESATAPDQFGVYRNYNRTITETLQKMRSNHVIFITIGMPETVIVDDEQSKKLTARRMFTYGKEHEGKLEREFLVVLWTATKTDKAGLTTYHFITNTNGVCSAKSPIGIFPNQLVPNDLAAALKLIDKSYGSHSATPANPV